MRRTATTILDAIKLAVLGTTSVLLLAPTVSAEQHGGGAGQAAGQTLMATINPVDPGLDRVAKTSVGTVKFTQGSGKVDVLVQASGIPLGGREAEVASDGGPATVGFDTRVLKGSDCAKVADDTTVLVELPQLRVQDDGSGVLMASTDKVTLQQLSGQLVVFSDPKNKHARIGCGVIGAK
jgi:hypothetical protein